jgi:hypothetical protein
MSTPIYRSWRIRRKSAAYRDLKANAYQLKQRIIANPLAEAG